MAKTRKKVPKKRRGLEKGVSKSSNAARRVGKKRTYTDAQKAQALMVLENNEGNVSATHRDTNIPINTIREWRDTNTINLNSDDPELIESIVLTTEETKLLNKMQQINFLKVEQFVKFKGLMKITAILDKCSEPEHLRDIMLFYKEAGKAAEVEKEGTTTSQVFNQVNNYFQEK
jgi:transposase-like protein